MKTLLFFAVAMFSAGMLTSCDGGETRPAESAAGKSQRTGIWIDVRTPEEFASGHLDGAANIPHDAIASRIAALVPDKTAEIHLYCRSGRRSGLARDTLLGLGYTKVTNDGSYEKLKDQHTGTTPPR